MASEVENALWRAMLANNGQTPHLDPVLGYYPTQPGLADLEIVGRGANLRPEPARTGIAKFLPMVSQETDNILGQISTIADQVRSGEIDTGRRKPSEVELILGQLLASLAPGLAGQVARTVQAPIDWAQGREIDYRPTDALLALPAVGRVLQKAAGAVPKLPISPTTVGAGGVGLGAFGIGAAEANRESRNVVGKPTPPLYDEVASRYRQQVQPPQAPGSLSEHLAKAEQAAKQDPVYVDMINRGRRTAANKYIDQTVARAQAAYQSEVEGFQRRASEYEAGIQQQFDREKADYDQRLRAYNDQGFWDREGAPYKPYAIGTAYALPAMLGLGTAMRRNAKGQQLFQGAVNAQKTGTPAEIALAENRAAEWLTPSKTLGEKLKSGAVTTGAMLAPFEIPAFGDVIDRSFGPEGSAARERAINKLSDPITYFYKGLPQMLSGASLYGIGNKVGQLGIPSPASDIRALSAPREPRMQAVAQERQLAERLRGDTEISKLEADARIRDARARLEPPVGPPTGPSGTQGPGQPLPPTGGPSGTQGPQPPTRPRPASSDWTYEGSPQQQQIQQAIVEQVGKGKSIPTIDELKPHLARNGVKNPVPKHLQQRLDNLTEIVTDLKTIGTPDDQIASFILKLMQSGKHKLPAIAAGTMGVGAVNFGDEPQN